MRLKAGIFLLLITGCSEPNDNAATAPQADAEDAAASVQRVSAILDVENCPSRDLSGVSVEEQKPMVEACNALHQRLRAANIIAHGGAKPGVEQNVWDSLSELKQAEVLLSAACLQSAGIPGPQAVSVVEAGQVNNEIANETICVRDPLQ